MGRLDEDEVLRRRLAAHLRRLIFERGWNQARVAKELGVTTPTVSTILANKRGMGIDVFARLHKQLGVDANELLDSDPPERFFHAGFSAEDMIDSTAAELRALATMDGLPQDLAQRIGQLAAELRRTRPRKNG